MKGTIIILSGLTSTGKTSIVNEIKSRREPLFFSVSDDMFEDSMPPWLEDDNDFGCYGAAVTAMYCAARSFSEQGRNVITDGLFMVMPGLEEHYKAVRRIFEGYLVKIVNVYCPLEILRQRNLARGDRGEFQSEKQAKLIDPAAQYDLTVDSSLHSPAECAELILRAFM